MGETLEHGHATPLYQCLTQRDKEKQMWPAVNSNHSEQLYILSFLVPRTFLWRGSHCCYQERSNREEPKGQCLRDFSQSSGGRLGPPGSYRPNRSTQLPSEAGSEVSSSWTQGVSSMVLNFLRKLWLLVAELIIGYLFTENRGPLKLEKALFFMQK